MSNPKFWGMGNSMQQSQFKHLIPRSVLFVFFFLFLTAFFYCPSSEVTEVSNPMSFDPRNPFLQSEFDYLKRFLR